MHRNNQCCQTCTWRTYTRLDTASRGSSVSEGQPATSCTPYSRWISDPKLGHWRRAQCRGRCCWRRRDSQQNTALELLPVELSGKRNWEAILSAHSRKAPLSAYLFVRHTQFGRLCRVSTGAEL